MAPSLLRTWNETIIILNRSTVEAALDDLSAQRREIISIKISQAFTEEFVQDFRSMVVGGLAHFRLRVYL